MQLCILWAFFGIAFGIGMTSHVYSNFGRKFLSITQYRAVLSHFSCAWLCVTLWAIACQAPLSMGFSRQEYQNGLPCPPQGDLPDPRIEFMSLKSPALAGGFFTTELPEKPKYYTTLTQKNEKQNTFSPWSFCILKTLMPCSYQSEIFNRILWIRMIDHLRSKKLMKNIFSYRSLF